MILSMPERQPRQPTLPRATSTFFMIVVSDDLGLEATFKVFGTFMAAVGVAFTAFLAGIENSPFEIGRKPTQMSEPD